MNICARNWHITKLFNKKEMKLCWKKSFKKLTVSPHSSVSRSKGTYFQGRLPNCETSVPFSKFPSVSKVSSINWEGWSRRDFRDSTTLHSVSLIRNAHHFCCKDFMYFCSFGWVWVGFSSFFQSSCERHKVKPGFKKHAWDFIMFNTINIYLFHSYKV